MSKRDWDGIVQDTMKGDTTRLFGTSKRDLKRTLTRRGYHCRTLIGTLQTKLNSLKAALSSGAPAILGCVENFGRSRERHYIVLKGMDRSGEHLYIHDPYPGKPSKIRLDSFLKNGQRISWGNARWGVIVRRDSESPGSKCSVGNK